MRMIKEWVVGLMLLIGLGCSPSHIGLHADFVTGAGITASAVDRGLNSVRATALDEIVDEARAECDVPNVCDQTRRDYWTDRLVTGELEWDNVLGCQAPINEAMHAYVDALETARLTADERLASDHLLARAARLGALWEALAVCVNSNLPPGASFELPTLPPGLIALIESLTTQPETEGE